jgi:hypothetical protein
MKPGAVRIGPNSPGQKAHVLAGHVRVSRHVARDASKSDTADPRRIDTQ